MSLQNVRVALIVVAVLIACCQGRHANPPVGSHNLGNGAKVQDSSILNVDSGPRWHKLHQQSFNVDSGESMIQKAQNIPQEDPFVAKQQYLAGAGAPKNNILPPSADNQKGDAQPYMRKRVELRREENANELKPLAGPKSQQLHNPNIFQESAALNNNGGFNNPYGNDGAFHKSQKLFDDKKAKPGPESDVYADEKQNSFRNEVKEKPLNSKLLKSVNALNVEYAKVILKAEEPEDDSPIEILCTVGFKEVAEIHWSVNGMPLEPFVDHTQVTTIKDEMPTKLSKLTVEQLERIPTETGKYLFECSAIVDGQLTKAAIAVGSTIDDKCKSNEDCKSRGAICAEEKCSCKARQPVSLKSRHVTCRPASQLGWPCHYSEQCSFAVTNSLCSKSLRCECTPGFQKTADGKLCTRTAGTYCASNTDCEFLQGTCENNLCACSNQTSLRMGLCIKPGSSPQQKEGNAHLVQVGLQENPDQSAGGNSTGGTTGTAATSSSASMLLMFLSALFIAAMKC